MDRQPGAGHSLQVAADHYLPTGKAKAPTDKVQSVAEAPLDFRTRRVAGIDAPFMDNNFCLSHKQAPLRDVSWLTGQSILCLRFGTSEAGVQVFNGPKGLRPGMGPHGGIASEAHGWTDAPNHPAVPAIALALGQTYHQITRWRFGRV